MALRKINSANSRSHSASDNSFQKIVQVFFRRQGRHELPWRKTTDPYKIVVSEIMLQQTQVPRVIEKYNEFLKQFPTIQKLARASLADVLRVWSGLGYNRRAKYLHQMAQVIVKEYKGKFPVTIEGLQKLPGIGPYTAGAVYAFAYNKPVPIIETNIRTVYIHHFFSNKKNISDKELIKKVETTLDLKNPRQWYWALMDYGSYLKANGVKNNSKSKHYTKQSTFEGSKRQIRGAIMREVLKGPVTTSVLSKILHKKNTQITPVLEDLVAEGLIKMKRSLCFL